MFKSFVILKYFHIQTSAIKGKYPTLTVRIFLVSVRTHLISRYSYSNTLRSQAKRSEVSQVLNLGEETLSQINCLGKRTNVSLIFVVAE